ncbi:polysaccharide pyruvyl transferase family protein [Agromyces intestinalis]|uniref:Polysaccharide pyruvyl transferase family protein n=1 Tax=Agromyces intestinalis TaxID=2592652 RepID=A0A5C1YDP7_9MICO|nr:polysaccharide pyruvyl transferase family protein [Agromyces intestinalis]QEO13670.1 polysaccharide pyruvyl transferase family protein [Agromyces intestinalis]
MTSVFVKVDGQNDNLGDSVLRRGLLRAVRGDGTAKLHVYVGKNDDDYLSSVGVRATDILYRSPQDWWRAGFGCLGRERTIFVPSAGEMPFDGPRYLSGFRLFVGSRLARHRSGGALHVGAGLRYRDTAVPPFERYARRSFEVVGWRDADTAAAFGRGEVIPDWAFAEGRVPGRAGQNVERSLLAVSMRGDRPRVSDEWIDLFTDLARSRGLDLAVVTQVRRDTPAAEDLARRLGAVEVILWEGESHVDWERRVRDVYGRSAIVAGDRAHGLIIAATEGAVPLAAGASTSKMERVLAPAGFDLRSMAGTPDYLREALSSPDFVETRVSAASEAVRAVARRIGEFVDADPR